MKQGHLNRLAAAGVCLMLSGIAAAADPDFGFEASAGYEYDSNVNVAQTDTNTGEADTATLLRVAFDAKIPAGERVVFRGSYDFSRTAYEEFSAFDIDLHHAFAEAAVRLGGIDLSVNAERFEALLDGEQFLQIDQVTPAVSKLFGSRIYLRGAYTRADKQYDTSPERNAINDAFRADVYLLFDGMERYLSLAVVTSSEDAVEEALAYDGLRAQLTYGHRLGFGPLELDLKARLQTEQRDYLGVTEAIGTMRRDDRLRAGVSASIPLGPYFEITGDIERLDVASNLDTAAYDETRFGLKLAASF